MWAIESRKKNCFATDIASEVHKFGDWLRYMGTIARPLLNKSITPFEKALPVKACGDKHLLLEVPHLDFPVPLVLPTSQA